MAQKGSVARVRNSSATRRNATQPRISGGSGKAKLQQDDHAIAARSGPHRDADKSRFLKRVPAQARGGRSVRNILKSCEELLGEMPFEQITVDDIASRAGVPVSSMYFFFQDRLSIFLHLIEVALNEIGDEYASADNVIIQPLSAYVRMLEPRLASIWVEHKDMLDLFFAYRAHPSISHIVDDLQKYVDGRVVRQLEHHFPDMTPARRGALARVINGNLMQGLDIASGLPAQRAQAFQTEWSAMLHGYLASLKA